MPNPKLLEEIQFNGFNLSEVLKTINERVEVLLDRDHTIGHSYFLKVKKNGDVIA
jgi:5-methylcytosine-specific restriction endonuclease McrBC GTP-binding regulatory subunit McrB